VKSMFQKLIVSIGIAGLVIASSGCKPKPSKPGRGSGRGEATQSSNKPAGEERNRPNGERAQKPGGSRAEQLEERKQKIEDMEKARELEQKLRPVRVPKYSETMVSGAAKEAQSSLDKMASFVGDPKATVVLTIKDPTANGMTLISANITGMDGDQFKGQVVRIDPKTTGSQYAEKADIIISKDQVVDWSCAKDTGSYGQFLMRAWLKDQSERAEDEAVRTEAQARLTRMGDALPGGAPAPTGTPAAPGKPEPEKPTAPTDHK